MKSKSLIAIIISALLIVSSLTLFAGCGKSPEAEPQSDAETASQTAAAQEQGNLFTKGVWVGNIDGNADTYFLFNDEKSGRTERADGSGGVSFTCEQSGVDVIFHFGSADDVTKAKFNLADNTGTFDYGNKKVTYTFVFIDGADPDTYEIPEPDSIFNKGVWSASIDGKIDTYFIFDSASSGRTERADGSGGVPFTVEQDGFVMVFHFGSEDDVTNAKFSFFDELTGTFEYPDKNVTYTFAALGDVDPETFEAPGA